MVKRKYSGWARGSPAYKPLSNIKRGSQTNEMLKFIGKQTYGYGGVNYAKIRSRFVRITRRGVSTTQGIDRTLRRLEETGLISRPKKGYYVITAKGKTAAYDLQHGLWRD